MLKSLQSPKHERLIDLLIDARRKAGLTQAALAARLQKHQSFVAKYESGDRRIDVIEFIELVRTIGDDPKKLFSRFLQSAELGSSG